MPIQYQHEVNPYVQAWTGYMAGHGKGQQAEADWRAQDLAQQRQQQLQATQGLTNNLFSHYSGMAQQAQAQQYRIDLQNQAHQQALEMVPIQGRRALNSVSMQQREVPWDDPEGGTGIVQMAQKANVPVDQFVQQFDAERAQKIQMAKLQAANMEMGFTDDQMLEQKRYDVQLRELEKDQTLTPGQKQQAAAQLQQRFAPAFQQKPVPRKSPFPPGQGPGEIFSLKAVNPAWPDLPAMRDYRGNPKLLMQPKMDGAANPLSMINGAQEAAAQQGINLSPAKAAQMMLESEDSDGLIHILDPKTGDVSIDASRPKLKLEARKAAYQILTASAGQDKDGNPVPVDPRKVNELADVLMGTTPGAQVATPPASQPASSQPAGASNSLPRGLGFEVVPQGWTKTDIVDMDMRPLHVPPGTDLEKIEDVPKSGKMEPFRIYRVGKSYGFFDGYTLKRVQRLP